MVVAGYVVAVYVVAVYVVAVDGVVVDAVIVFFLFEHMHTNQTVACVVEKRQECTL